MTNSAWPVRLVGAGRAAVSTGAVLWRVRGAASARLTIVVKATFTLQSEAAATVRAPAPLVTADVHLGDDPRRSLGAASDLAPYRTAAEVLLTGVAYAPPGRAAAGARAGLLVQRDGHALVHKAIEVQGDRVARAGRLSEPAPFQHMPLVYERAVLHAEENPAGVDPASGRAPNLVHPAAPGRPACFAPIPRTWPVRARLLRGLSPAAVSGARLDLPADFDWSFFFTSPADQRLGPIRGDEVIQLEGMHPALPVLRTRLPGARARACVYRGAAAGAAVDLWADTLLLDTRAQTGSLVFRSNIEVDEAELGEIVVAAGVELPGAPLTFLDRLPAAALAPGKPPKATPEEPAEGPEEGSEEGENPLAGTRGIQTVMARRPALPFGGRPAPPEMPSPRIPARAPAPPPEDNPLGGTRAVEDAGPQGPALPFGPQRREPSSPRIPEALPPPPAPPAEQAPPPEENPLAGTQDATDFAAYKPVIPFDPSRPAALPAASEPRPRRPEPEEEANPLGGTVQLTETLQRELGRRLILPFVTETPPAPPADEPRSAPLLPPDIPPRTTDTPPVLGDPRIAVVVLPWQVRPPRDSFTIVLKASCAIVPGGPAALLAEPDLPTGDLYHDDDLQKSVRYPSDLALFKPRADVTLSGRAFAPGGSSPAARVELRFGRGKAAFSRALAVFGDRRWDRGVVTTAPTDPRPFTAIRLAYERAFGGPGFDDNPCGVGFRGAADGDGVPRLPNFEDPARLVKAPGDRPPPAGFGPIAPLWKQRWSQLGTYDARWLADRWPYFPEDFGWTFFQHAPAAQQLDHLTGDEPFTIVGMHPEYPRLEGSLPALRVRCFYQQTEAGGGAFGEVRLALDTVHFDVDAMKTHMVYRGVLEVSDDDGPEIAALFVSAEPLGGAAATLEQAREALHAALRGPTPRPEEAEPANVRARRPPPAPPPAGEVEADRQLAAFEAEARERGAKLDEQLRAAGIPEAPAPGAPPDGAELLARMRAAGAGEAQLAELAALFAPLEEPPRAAPDPTRTAQVIAMLDAGASFDGVDLRGEDLSGLDFSRRSMVGVDLRDARLRACRFDGAALTEALLAGADLTDATLDGADLGSADLTGCILEGASAQSARIGGADLTGAQARRARFDGASGEGVTFTGAVLDDARFEGASLPGADFQRSSLARATFTRADLRDVILYDASGEAAVFDGARLDDARGDGARLPAALFRGAAARGSVWERASLDGASFLKADLVGASFARAECRRAVFSAADLTEANLRRAKLERAQIFGANLLGAVLERADLTGADLRRSNLHGAETWRARLDGAALDFAIVTQSKLGRRA